MNKEYAPRFYRIDKLRIGDKWIENKGLIFRDISDMYAHLYRVRLVRNHLGKRTTVPVHYRATVQLNTNQTAVIIGEL